MFLGGCAIEGVVEFPFLYLSSGRGYLAFFGGIVLNQIYRLVCEKKCAKVMSTTSGTILGICVVAWICSPELYDNMRMILVFIVYPAMILFALSSTQITKIFNKRIFEFLGGISFEMYIWHFPFITISQMADYITGHEASYSIYTMISFVIFVIVFSSFVYSVIEKRIMYKLQKLLLCAERTIERSE